MEMKIILSEDDILKVIEKEIKVTGAIKEMKIEDKKVVVVLNDARDKIEVNYGNIVYARNEKDCRECKEYVATKKLWCSMHKIKKQKRD